MMESFMLHGDYFVDNGIPRVEPFYLPRRYYSLVNMSMWAVVTLLPVFYLLFRLVTSGSTIYISIGISIILFCEYASHGNFRARFTFYTKGTLKKVMYRYERLQKP